MLAISKAGHDKGTWYYVLREEGDIVYLADGRIRTVDRPKKKNRRHISPVNDETIARTDEEIKKLIKERTKAQTKA